MKKFLFILFVIPAIIFSCQKEAVDLGDVLDDLELKSDDDSKDGEGKGNACFEIQFPLTVIMPDHSEVSADSRDGLAKAVKKWYAESGKDQRQKISLKFPITLVFRGETLTIERERGLERIRMACRGDKEGDRDKKPCFRLVYPLSYTMPDGTTLTRDSKEAMDAAMKRWYGANQSDKRPTLQFPVKINYGSSDRGDRILEVANKEALNKAYKDCER